MIITCVGDSGVDSYVNTNTIRPGGIALNVAFHSRNLFPTQDIVQIIGAIGNDSESTFITETLKKFSIISHLETLEGKTPTQYINLDEHGEKIFTKYDEGVLRNYILNQKQKEIIQSSDLIVTVIFEQIEGLFESVITCSRQGLLAVDFMNLGDYKKSTDIVKKYIENFDIGFFGLKSSDTDLITDLQNIAKNHKKLFVITLGGDGSIAYDKDTEYREGAVAVEKIVDTTGAGDAFAAAFLHTYAYTRDVKKSLMAGNIYAAKIVQQIGSF